MYTPESELQLLNALLSISSTLDGIAISISELQLLNAYEPMLIILFGIVRFERELQLWKA